MALVKTLKNIAKFFGSSLDEAAALAARYGDDVVDMQKSRIGGDVRRAYELGRNAGAFGKPITSQEEALLVMRDLATNRAYTGGVSAKDLSSVPEFDEYFNAYRAHVIDPKTGELRRGVNITQADGTLSKVYTDTAAPNVGTEKLLGVQPFVGTNVTGELIEAARAGDKKRFAEAMAKRVSNHMALLSRLDMEAAEVAGRYGLTQSAFYGAANDLHGLISEVTGIPRQMITNAMAVASAGSSPYDELLKLSAAAPYMKMGKAGVVFDEAAALADGVIKLSEKTGKASGDKVYVAAKALEASMNGLDPMVDDMSGLALKTYQYRNMMAVPDLQNISVSDRIAQRLASGSIDKVDKSQGDIVAASPDWVADQAIGAAEGVTAAVPQEGAWFAQRVSEIMRGGKGISARTQTGQAYPFSADEIESLFTNRNIPGLEERVVEGRRIGKNYKVAAGGRTIDPGAVAYAQQFSDVGIPSVSTPQPLLSLPPSMRQQYNVDVTESGLSLARAIGPLLRELRTPKTYALAALAGSGLMAANNTVTPYSQPLQTEQANAPVNPFLLLAQRDANRRMYEGNMS